MSDRPISLENLDERTAPPAAPVLVSVVLDESGSMASVWAATVAGFNEYVTKPILDEDVLLQAIERCLSPTA